MNSRVAALGWFIGLLVLASLACGIPTGEILTPEEATARVEQTREARFSSNTSSEEGGFQADDVVVFVGEEYLIPMFQEAGGEGNPFSFAGRGDEATVIGSRDVDGVRWYRVETSAGTGWVNSEYLQAAGGGGGEATASTAANGPQAGDTVYLTATGFLVNLYNEVGGGRIVANQQRGAEVTVIGTEAFEGETWYFIEAPTGEGWVPAENISTEAPE